MPPLIFLVVTVGDFSFAFCLRNTSRDSSRSRAVFPRSCYQTSQQRRRASECLITTHFGRVSGRMERNNRAPPLPSVQYYSVFSLTRRGCASCANFSLVLYPICQRRRGASQRARLGWVGRVPATPYELVGPGGRRSR